MGFWRQRALAGMVIVLLVGTQSRAVVCLEACASLLSGIAVAHAAGAAEPEAACHETSTSLPSGGAGFSAADGGWCGGHQNPLTSSTPVVSPERAQLAVPATLVASSAPLAHASFRKSAFRANAAPPPLPHSSPVLRI